MKSPRNYEAENVPKLIFGKTVSMTQSSSACQLSRCDNADDWPGKPVVCLPAPTRKVLRHQILICRDAGVLFTLHKDGTQFQKSSCECMTHQQMKLSDAKELNGLG